MTDWPYRYWLTYEELQLVGPVLEHMPWLKGQRFDPGAGRLYLDGPEIAGQTAEKCFELSRQYGCMIQVHGEPI